MTRLAAVVAAVVSAVALAGCGGDGLPTSLAECRPLDEIFERYRPPLSTANVREFAEALADAYPQAVRRYGGEAVIERCTALLEEQAQGR